MSLIATAAGREAATAFGDVLRGQLGTLPLADRVRQGVDPALWKVLTDGGWNRLTRPEDQGDVTFTLIDLCGIAEVCGHWLVGVPLLETLLVNRRLSMIGASGVERAAYAIPGHESGVAIVPAVRAGELVLFDDQEEPHLLAEADVRSVDAFAPSLRLTYAASPSTVPTDTLREVAVLMAASATGAANAALQTAVQYAGQRTQYGKPIAQLQAVAHRLADMFVAVTMARSAVAWAADNDTALAEGTLAATRLAQTAVDGAIQVHGGIGFTWEAGIHFYLRHVIQCRKAIRAATRPWAPVSTNGR